MYPGPDRSTWQQPVYPERASPPQSQTGWFPLQDAEQQQPSAQQSQSGWLADTTSPSHDQRVYASSPMYSSMPAPSPPFIWTGEAHPHSPPARTMQFLSSPTYPRPLVLSDPGLYDREDGQKAKTILRHNKQIAIGRWNTEEHQWFLKGLEMFQGPAWGEIARLIGTRTSTQVRTHAQKFFTKMARLNQTMPYFEAQIQKERARLVAQGASVTPTAQNTPSASVAATLSPRKRLASTSNSPRQSLRRFKEEAAKSPTYGIAVQARYHQDTQDPKPRVYTGGLSSSASPSSGPSMTKEWSQQHWAADDARQWPLASPTSTAASLQLTQLQLADVGQPTTSASADAESLPSMNKLLCRSTSS
eukprot:jgi/Phyca11/4857/fgenesh1_pm.PHYCAscaffold_3_\